jgi:hypothetical protein
MAALACIVLTACVSTPPTQQRAGSVNPDDEPLVNTLRWTTASEVSNFGFDIYRGDTENGPFTRITASPIPGAGTTDEPQSYVWVDDAIDPSRDYWYYIESISMDSIRERFSPIIRAPAKRSAGDD